MADVGGTGEVGDVQRQILQKVGEVSSSIAGARCVDDAICALHSLAVLLFPVDSILLSGVIGEGYRAQVLDINVPKDGEKVRWRHDFYHGVAFPTMAKILIYDIALKWLACFPLAARTQIYDSFFIRGPSTEIVQALVPGLTRNKLGDDIDHNAFYSNVERLLVLCLLDNGGIHIMAHEFGEANCREEYADKSAKSDSLSFISRMAQLVASIPDKSRLESPSTLSSHLFFKKIIIQLLDAAEESAIMLFKRNAVLYDSPMCSTFYFVGQMFMRICRRGSADTLVAVTIPRVLYHVKTCISSGSDCIVSDMIISNPKSLFWLNLMGHVKDSYSVEKLAEELLNQLASIGVNDLEAYWTLWVLFHMICKHEKAARLMFVDKFLLWKVFPICCLRWILQFSVFEFPPDSGIKEFNNTQGFLDTVQRILGVWSKREFIQTASMEQQAYITAAIGLSLGRMSKEELETTRDVLNSILEGVSCRLESPVHLTRQMASSVALVFSKIVDPKNPLYLDDSSKENETIDWEFGLIPLRRRLSSYNTRKGSGDIDVVDANTDNNGCQKVATKNKFSFSDLSLVDQASVNDDVKDDNDAEIEISEISEDSSLLPYDLSDDDTDLDRRYSQVLDVVAALRKTDEPDNVERALDVVERLIRASPDELQHHAADLTKTLVQIRCSDIAVEGNEDSAEMKRHKALVALLTTCPFESLNVITRLLYSSNVDVSQRFLVLDVMSDAAQELADSKIMRARYQSRNLIMNISSSQPWFLPSNRGPSGSSPWEDVSERESPLSWSRHYERTIPSKPGKTKAGKSRCWSLRAAKAEDGQMESTRNKFPLYAAAFMLPAMQGFDRRKHGVDLLGRDFIVLGKLIHMLGVCMRCIAMHPEASALALPLLDMLSSRDVAHHPEAYVRRSVLYTASCILTSLHPSFVASALIEGDKDISRGLEWIRTWAFHVYESDPDTECTSLAMTCLQLHSEMALQTSRTLESADCFRAKTGIKSSTTKNDIIVPISGNRQLRL